MKYNGDSGTTNCHDFIPNNYGDVQRKADFYSTSPLPERSELSDAILEYTMETNAASYNNEIDTTIAGYLHRNDSITSPNNCAVRSRLTPSLSSKIGSMWYREAVPVSDGFDTYFTFQISDHSKECTLHRDQYFSLIHHRTCSVHGGDGFAFVIQNDPNNTYAIGKVGGHLGFGGIHNSLAIAFDTFCNPGYDQVGVDHLSIQSKGNLANSGYDDAMLGTPKVYDLADGKIHLVRITYWNSLIPKYLEKVVASDLLLPYLKDNGEGKRLGTLVVYIDDGVLSDTPIMALPINLSVLLDMPSDQAYIGFTSSTGKYYEKHDIISWYWCDHEPCEKATNTSFNYHQYNNITLDKIRQFVPGKGFGGSDGAEGFPIKQQSPDTDPWNLLVNHHSLDRNTGLAPDAASQIPPNTIYR